MLGDLLEVEERCFARLLVLTPVARGNACFVSSLLYYSFHSLTISGSNFTSLIALALGRRMGGTTHKA